jgi:tRNA threonylcarbamoyladenosine biosynthesis protein TsaE
MQKTYDLLSLEHSRILAQALAEHLAAGDTVLLSGPVGAGKTALARLCIQARLAEIGALEDVPSPTFTLVQVYDLQKVELWHADLYRITTVDEVYELGLDMAFDEAICLIEWPENLGPLKPKNALSIDFTLLDETHRRVSLEWQDSKWDSVIAVLDFLKLPQG